MVNNLVETHLLYKKSNRSKQKNMFKLKKIPIYLIACLVTMTGFIQAQDNVSIDSLYRFIKANSAWNRGVNWDGVDSLYSRLIQNTTNYQDSLFALAGILEEMNDRTSYFIYKNEKISVARKSKSKIVNQELQKRSEEEKDKIIRTKFNRGVAYLRLSGFSAQDSIRQQQIAQAIYDSIVLYNPAHVKAYILDLRLMAAGQLEPVLAGLMPLLGEGIFAKETDPYGRIVHSWSIKKEALLKDDVILFQLTDRKLKGFNEKPLVILIGPMTSHCGKLIGIALKRRPQSIFIGEITSDDFSGLTSRFEFNDQLQLYLAHNFFADRSNSIYPEHLSPDKMVTGGDKFDRLLFDNKVKAAFDWIVRVKM